MLKEIFIAELSYEAKTTRNFLSRIPAELMTWKPDEKSMSLGDIAIHIANLPGWGLTTLIGTSFDLASPEAEEFKKNQPDSPTDIQKLFDKNIAALEAILQNVSDDDFAINWSLKMGDNIFFTQPRYAVLRSFFFSHLIHHRAQLGVYFRLNGIPVPPSFGPTADEQA
ncbi:MAG: DinB family protein [bacterium]